MATIYVNASSEGTAGNDTTGNGSAALPYLTLAKLLTVMADGDTAYLSGTFEEQMTFTNAVNRSSLQWPAMPTAVLRGDRAFNPSWTLDSGNSYWATLSGTNTLVSVTYLWDAHIDASGRHYGHLISVASIALCRSTSNSWFHDTVANRLYVNIGGGAPASGTVRWCKGGGSAGSNSGIFFTNNSVNTTAGATGCVVKGLHFYCFCDGNGSSYSMRAEGAVNCVFEDLVGLDSAWHTFGLLNGPQTNTVFRRCVTWGSFAPSGLPPTQFVVHTTNTGTGNVVRGVVFEDCAAYVYPALDPTGAELAAQAATTLYAFFGHSDVDASLVDIQHTRCLVTIWASTGARARYPGAYSQTAIPVDPAVWSNYGVRYLDHRITGAGTFVVAGTSHQAFLRGSLDITQCAAAGFAGAGGLQFADSLATNYTLLQGTEIITNTNNTGATALSVLIGNNHHIRMFNVSMIEVGGDTSSGKNLFYWSSVTGNKVIARDCIFGYVDNPATGLGFQWLNRADASATAAQLDFLNNLYVNIVEGHYSAAAARDTWAEWISVIDAQGAKTTQQVFLNPFRDTRLNQMAAGYVTATPTSPNAASSGVNGRVRTGRGAWGYGSVIGSQVALDPGPGYR